MRADGKSDDLWRSMLFVWLQVNFNPVFLMAAISISYGALTSVCRASPNMAMHFLTREQSNDQTHYIMPSCSFHVESLMRKTEIYAGNE